MEEELLKVSLTILRGVASILNPQPRRRPRINQSSTKDQTTEPDIVSIPTTTIERDGDSPIYSPR
jgi:hypothetical protein